jgi:hypothetical protein
VDGQIRSRPTRTEILLGGNAVDPNQKSVLVAKAKAAPTPVRLTTRADTNSEQTTRDPRPVPENSVRSRSVKCGGLLGVGGERLGL